MLKCVYVLLLIVASASGFSQVNLSTSLSACYPLNGNATEQVNTLTGTLSAAVTATLDRFNNTGSACYFNGSSYIRLPNSTLLKAGMVSFSCWVKFNSVSNPQFIAFVHNGCGSMQEGYQLALTSLPGGARFQVAKTPSGCNPQVTLNGSTILSTGVWYHCGFYAGPDSLKLYVNGNLEASLASANALAYNPTANVFLGGSASAPLNLYLSGSLDNARFYNRKLNNSEMNQLYLLDPSCTSAPTPNSAFNASAISVCVNQVISFSDASTNSPTSWNWLFQGPSPGTSTLSNPSVSFASPGIYTVSLIASNSAGPGNQAVQTITVLPTPVVTVTPLNPSICNGETITLTASGANTYSWSNGASTNTTVVSPTFNTGYAVVGTSGNCSSLAMITVTVNQTPVVSINNGTICSGESFTLSPSGANTYTVSGGAMVVSPLTSTNYVVTGTSSEGCISASPAIANVVVNPLPDVTVSPATKTICAGEKIILTAGGAVSYSWNSGANSFSMQAIPATSTVYVVKGSVYGCARTASVAVTVKTCTGLKEHDLSGEVIAFPNPALAELLLQNKSEYSYSVQLTDLLGRSVAVIRLLPSEKQSVSLESVATGIYIMKAERSDGILWTKKIVKGT